LIYDLSRHPDPYDVSVNASHEITTVHTI